MSPRPITSANRYRSSAAALRGIRARNGKTAATDAAIDRHEKTKADSVEALLAADRFDPDTRHLVGLLVAEEDLAERLRTARRLGQDRPELQARINAIRAELRSLS